MFLSSRPDQFKFNFPRTFIPKDIADKYRPVLNKMPGSMIKEPIDAFNYGIQSMNLPGPSYDPVVQHDRPGFERNFRSAVPTQQNYDKQLTITMQSFDGFFNYWMAVELFDYYYSLDGSSPWVPEGIGIQLFDGEGNTFVNIQMKEMLLTSVSALDLNFSTNAIEFQTFDLNFKYNILDIKYGYKA